VTVGVYGLGHIPDPPHVVAALSSSRSMATSPMLVRPFEFIREIKNQRGAGKCVGAGLAQGFALRARALGFDVSEISDTAIYRMARQGDNPVTDSGCQPYQACAYAMARGLVPESRWPSVWAADGWTQANVNDPLPLDVWEHALDARITHVGVEDLSDADAIRQAIDSGFPVAWSTVVDAAWDNYTSGYLGPPSGPIRGRHYTLLVDHDDQGAIGVNSWSTGWGAAYAGFSGGFYRASWARLADVSSTDGRIIEIGPKELT